MARREKTVVGWYGRDEGRHYHLTEKSAYAASKWAWRFGLVVKGTEARIPPELMQYGIVAIAATGLNAFFAADIDAQKLEPLWAELFECVEMIRDPKHPDVKTKLIIDVDIQEIATIEWLKKEVLDLHAGFPWVGNLLGWFSTIWTALQSAQSSIQTSRPTSDSSSAAEKPPSMN